MRKNKISGYHPAVIVSGLFVAGVFALVGSAIYQVVKQKQNPTN
jgi:hypothetical protein